MTLFANLVKPIFDAFRSRGFEIVGTNPIWDQDGNTILAFQTHAVWDLENPPDGSGHIMTFDQVVGDPTASTLMFSHLAELNYASACEC